MKYKKIIILLIVAFFSMSSFAIVVVRENNRDDGVQVDTYGRSNLNVNNSNDKVIINKNTDSNVGQNDLRNQDNNAWGN